MKNIIYTIIVLASILSISSCSKDDSTKPSGTPIKIDGADYVIPKINMTNLSDLESDLKGLFSSVTITPNNLTNSISIKCSQPSVENILFSKVEYTYNNKGTDGFIFEYTFKTPASASMQKTIIELYNNEENTYMITPLVTE